MKTTMSLFLALFLTLIVTMGLAQAKVLNLETDKTNQVFVNSENGEIVLIVTSLSLPPEDKIKFIDSNGIKSKDVITLESDAVISAQRLSGILPGLFSEIALVDDKGYIADAINNKIYVIDVSQKKLIKVFSDIYQASNIIADPLTKKIYFQMVEVNPTTLARESKIIVIDAVTNERVKEILVDFSGTLEVDNNNLYLKGGETLQSLYGDIDGDLTLFCQNDNNRKTTITKKIAIIDLNREEVKEEVNFDVKNNCKDTGISFIYNDKAYLPRGKKALIYDLKTKTSEERTLFTKDKFVSFQIDKKNNILYARLDLGIRNGYSLYKLVPFNLLDFSPIKNYKSPSFLFGATFVENLDTFYYFTLSIIDGKLVKLGLNTFNGFSNNH